MMIEILVKVLVAKNSTTERFGQAINSQPLGRIVAGDGFYFIPAMSCGRDRSLCIQNIAHSEGFKRRLKPPLAVRRLPDLE